MIVNNLESPLYLVTSGIYLPQISVPNQQLADWFNRGMGLKDGAEGSSSAPIIEKLSGIQSRRMEFTKGIATALKPEIPVRGDGELSLQADYGVRATKAALSESGLAPSEIDIIVFASSAIQRPYPAIAIEIAGALGMPGFGMDLNVGCSSATFAVSVVEQFLRTGMAKTGLVVTAEFPTLYANWKDRGSNFLFGDAGTALLLSTVHKGKEPIEMVSTQCWSNYSTNIRNNVGFLSPLEKGEADRKDLFFYQNGPKVFKDVVKFVPDFISAHLARHELKTKDVSRYWLHQANARLNEAIVKRMELEGELKTIAPSIIEKYGNSAASGAIVAFHETKSQLRSGQYGYLCAFGAGYSAGGVLIKRT